MTLWKLCFVWFVLWCVRAQTDSDSGHDQTAHFIERVSSSHHSDAELDISKLLIGEPLVGAVEQGESQLVEFGIRQRGAQFPDILLFLEAVNPDARVDVYCTPRSALNRQFPPDRITSSWQTTLNGEMFISSKSVQYKKAIVRKIVDGEHVQVAEFACAIRGNSGGNAAFELTMKLSFDERALHPEQRRVMTELFDRCCSGEKQCHRWLFKEQQANGGAKSTLEEIEFDFCHRTGSLCNVAGDLVRLDLRSYGLKCKLPTDLLLELTTLESLDLSDNNIDADITEDVVQLGGLRHLRDLSFEKNFIYGEMHAASICSKLLKNLRTIDLDDNHITGKLPSCMFSDLPLLEEIYLSRNHITGYISDLFSSMSSLKALTLSGNDLTGTLPPSLGRIKTLRVLSLDRNLFNGAIPESFASLRNLEILDLSNNRLSSLPSSWSTVWHPPKSLHILMLQNNKLHGKLPSRLLRAHSLRWLDLSSNFISGHLFAMDGMFPKMTYFNVSTNQLTGPIPKEFSSMGVFGNARRTGPLHVFDISFNKLSGLLPEFMYQEDTPTIMETELFLEGNHFRCHRWKTLNYVPNFDCDVHSQQSKANEISASQYIQYEELHHHHPASTANQTQLTLSNSASDASVSSPSGGGSGNEATIDAIVGVVSTVLGVLVIVGVIFLIVKFKGNRNRRLGLQYGAADDIDSDDGTGQRVPNGNPGPSLEPQEGGPVERTEV